METMNIEKVIKEMDNLMEEAKPEPMLRNSVITELVGYMNNLQNKYVFQTGYKVSYTSKDCIKRRLDYSKIQDSVGDEWLGD